MQESYSNPQTEIQDFSETASGILSSCSASRQDKYEYDINRCISGPNVRQVQTNSILHMKSKSRFTQSRNLNIPQFWSFIT